MKIINGKKLLAVLVAVLAIGFLSMVYAHRQEKVARQNRATHAAEAQSQARAPEAPWYAFWQ